MRTKEPTQDTLASLRRLLIAERSKLIPDYNIIYTIETLGKRIKEDYDNKRKH